MVLRARARGLGLRNGESVHPGAICESKGREKKGSVGGKIGQQGQEIGCEERGWGCEGEIFLQLEPAYCLFPAKLPHPGAI